MAARDRYELDDRFARGVLFHTGTLATQIDDRIVVLPISSLWR